MYMNIKYLWLVLFSFILVLVSYFIGLYFEKQQYGVTNQLFAVLSDQTAPVTFPEQLSGAQSSL